MGAHEGLSPADFAHLFEPLTSFDHILVAVSGGVDSTVLLHALSQWVRPQTATNPANDKMPLKISVVCVDHGLRDGSAHEARAVKHRAEMLGCDCAVLRWRGEKPVTRLQEKARSMRYELLQKHARKIGAEAIVLAHHADDQAETMLMRMAAGSGPEGLCGMQVQTKRDGMLLVRPFLSLPKSALVATARAAEWDWHEDPSNQQERFERVRLRRMQALREGAGLTSARLVRLAARLARQQEAINWMAEQSWSNVSFLTGLDAPEKATVVLQAALWTLPAEIGIRVIAKAVHVLKPDAALRLERIETLHAVLRDWERKQQKGRRTLGGCVLNLSRDGVLTLTPEPLRLRGRRFKD